MFYSADIHRTSSLGDRISTLRDCSKEVRGELGSTEVLQQRAGSWNIKRLLLIKENQISQVKEFSAFLCMRRCKSLGSLKSFLCYAPQLSGASILCFLILSFLKLHRWGGCSLTMARWPAGIPCVHPEFPQPYGVAAISDGCYILCSLLWQTIFYFSLPME